MSELRLKLKTATQPLHDRVEATDVMSGLMRDDLTEARYAATLAGLHRLYVPLEAALSRVPGLKERLPDVRERFKADSLRRDLAALGHAPVTADVLSIAPIADPGAAFGTLYVLEGSTMGGRLIANALRGRAFVTPERLHFFTHYGDQAGRYWQTFLKALDQLPEAAHPAAIDAARVTFGYFISLARD